MDGLSTPGGSVHRHKWTEDQLTAVPVNNENRGFFLTRDEKGNTTKIPNRMQLGHDAFRAVRIAASCFLSESQGAIPFLSAPEKKVGVLIIFRNGCKYVFISLYTDHSTCSGRKQSFSHPFSSTLL